MVVRDSCIHSVASSDAKNIKTSIIREGDEIVISGHKWLGGGLNSHIVSVRSYVMQVD